MPASTLRAAISSTPLAEELETIERALSRTELDPALRFDRGAYDPRVVARVAGQWQARMVFEHRSSTVFSQLAAQLYEANATLDAKIVMLRMAQDELRHTATCAEVVRALGGDDAPEVDLAIEALASHRGVSPEERALRNVVYTTACSEMVACARFVATLDHTTDPYLRQALRRLLADEILHAQFGLHYLEAWRPWLEAHPDVIGSLERYVRHAFAVLEGELAPRPPFAPLEPDARALGADDPALAREVFYGTMEGAIVPGLERFGIDAGRAWRERVLAG